MWLRKSCKLTLILLMLVQLGCAENVFLSTADKTSDEALEIDARRALSQGQWTVAISKITSMSAAKQAEDDTIYLLASAYGGQCGLSFLTFSTAFGSIGATAFFTFLLEHFVDSDATAQTACVNAESTYESISASPTTADYINRTYLAMAKVGTVLNKINRAESGGSNTYDNVNFDPCTDITDDDANEIFTGLSRIITNAAGAGIGGVPACPGGADCNITDASAVTATERTAIRSLLNGADPGMSGPGGC